jgi:phosphate transport system substrate-binding protein
MKARIPTMMRALRTIIPAIVLGAFAIVPAPASAAAVDSIALPGTGDSTDVLRALAKSYMAQYPGREVAVPNSIGSDGGIRVVGTGESPIGRVARVPNAAERAKYGEFTYVEFARVPVAFVVTPESGVTNLSEQQICEAFSGRVTNWKQVGGRDLAIAVQSRPDGSNLQTIRKNIACFATLEWAPTARFNEHNPDLVAAMKTAGAVGFMPLSEAVLHGYRTVTLDGVAPTAQNYKLGIGLGFVHRGVVPSAIRAFLDYLATEPARTIMLNTGHVPVAR